jgi:hypothetical protein
MQNNNFTVEVFGLIVIRYFFVEARWISAKSTGNFKGTFIFPGWREDCDELLVLDVILYDKQMKIIYKSSMIQINFLNATLASTK